MDTKDLFKFYKLTDKGAKWLGSPDAQDANVLYLFDKLGGDDDDVANPLVEDVQHFDALCGHEHSPAPSVVARSLERLMEKGLVEQDATMAQDFNKMIDREIERRKRDEAER